MNLSRKMRLLSAAFLALLLCGGCGRKSVSVETPSETVSQQTVRDPETGTTLLLICLAPFAPDPTEAVQRNDWQADMLLLLGMDEETDMVEAVQLDPDTQALFRLPDGEERTLPLAQVYSYGSGGSDSSLRMCQQIAGLAGLGKIEHYITLTPEAIGLLVELLSPVEVRVTEPVPDGPESLAQPGTVELDPESAIAFFAFRKENGDNSEHMANQRALIKALYQALPEGEQIEELTGKMVMSLGENMQTDLTLSQMLGLLEQTEEMPLTNSIRVYEQGEMLW